MTSMLVFAIAFAVGCLSGVAIALWPTRRRADKPGRGPSLWPMRNDESTTVHRIIRR